MEKKSYKNIEGKVEALLNEIDVKHKKNNAMILGKYDNTLFFQAKGDEKSLATTLVFIMAGNPIFERAVFKAVECYLDHEKEVKDMINKDGDIETNIKEI